MKTVKIYLINDEEVSKEEFLKRVVDENDTSEFKIDTRNEPENLEERVEFLEKENKEIRKKLKELEISLTFNKELNKEIINIGNPNVYPPNTTDPWKYPYSLIVYCYDNNEFPISNIVTTTTFNNSNNVNA